MFHSVIIGLDPMIRHLPFRRKWIFQKHPALDCRVKPGNDERGFPESCLSFQTASTGLAKVSACIVILLKHYAAILPFIR